MRKSMLVAAIAAVAFGGGFFAHDAIAQDDAAPKAAKEGGKGDKKGGERRGGGLAQAALKVSGLTDDQKAKLEAIQKEQGEKMKAVRDEVQNATDDAAKKAAREKMMESNKEVRGKIEAILTADQKKEFEAAIPQRGSWGGKKDDASTGSQSH